MKKDSSKRSWNEIQVPHSSVKHPSLNPYGTSDNQYNGGMSNTETKKYPQNLKETGYVKEESRQVLALNNI